MSRTRRISVSGFSAFGFVLLAAIDSPGASAAGYSMDIELVRPAFSAEGVPGVDSPKMINPGVWQYGLMGQYEQDPLILYGQGDLLGSVVNKRQTAHVGVAYDFNDKAGVRLVLPYHNNQDTEVPEFSAEGGGLGDLILGARFQAVALGPWTGGVSGQFFFPTGRQSAWMGEETLRTGLGLLSQLDVGPVSHLLDVGVVTRTAVETEEDFQLGSELWLNSALKGEVWRERIWIYAGVVSRAGFSAFWQGGAENSLEGLTGLQARPRSNILVDLGFGKGITDGYGTTFQRLLCGVTMTWPVHPPEPPEIEMVKIPGSDLPPEIDPEADELIEEERKWKQGELARVEGERIVIRDPIQFEFNTARILPDSIGTLRYVGGLLRKNDRIGHLVVEGHASEEGTFVYNYDLSIRRARAVWEQLILAEVHPTRLSYRGMGEVIPVAKDGSQMEESELAMARRVEFHIVRQLGPLELAEKHQVYLKLPWSGEDATISAPPPGQFVTTRVPERVIAPEEQLPEDEDLFDEDDDKKETDDKQDDKQDEEESP